MNRIPRWAVGVSFLVLILWVTQGERSLETHVTHAAPVARPLRTHTTLASSSSDPSRPLARFGLVAASLWTVFPALATVPAPRLEDFYPPVETWVQTAQTLTQGSPDPATLSSLLGAAVAVASGLAFASFAMHQVTKGLAPEAASEEVTVTTRTVTVTDGEAFPFVATEREVQLIGWPTIPLAVEVAPLLTAVAPNPTLLASGSEVSEEVREILEDAADEFPASDVIQVIADESSNPLAEEGAASVASVVAATVATSATTITAQALQKVERRDVVQRIAGVAALGIADVLMASLLTANGVPFPATVVTLLVTFASLCLLGRVNPSAAERVVAWFTPAVSGLSRWMAFMFVPLLVNIPAVADLITPSEVGLLAGLLVLRSVAMTALDGTLGAYLFRGVAPALAPPPPAKDGDDYATLPAIGYHADLGAILITALSGMWLSGIWSWLAEYATLYRWAFHLSAPVVLYISGVYFQRKLTRASPRAGKLFQPVVFAAAAMAAALALVARLQHEPFALALQAFNPGSPLRGAGDAIVWLLRPTVVAMAFGMFQKRGILFSHFVPLMTLTLAHAAAAMLLTAVGCQLAGLSAPLTFSALTHSATVPLAVESTKLLGVGAPSLTAALAVATGVIGAVTGLSVLDAFKVTNPMARGVSVGANGHGLGTANVNKEEPASAPFAAMSFALVGIFTACLCSVPAFQKLLFTFGNKSWNL